MVKLTSWPPLSRKIVQFQIFGTTGMVLLPRNMLIEPEVPGISFPCEAFSQWILMLVS